MVGDRAARLLADGAEGVRAALWADGHLGDVCFGADDVGPSGSVGAGPGVIARPDVLGGLELPEAGLAHTGGVDRAGPGVRAGDSDAEGDHDGGYGDAGEKFAWLEIDPGVLAWWLKWPVHLKGFDRSATGLKMVRPGRPKPELRAGELNQRTMAAEPEAGYYLSSEWPSVSSAAFPTPTSLALCRSGYIGIVASRRSAFACGSCAARFSEDEWMNG